MTDYLTWLTVLLGAALLFVMLFRRLGLGATLGYIVGGIVIGPSVLGLSGDAEAINRVSEIGIALLLFIVGLELQPSRLWRMKQPRKSVGLTAMIGTKTARLDGASIFPVGKRPSPGWTAMAMGGCPLTNMRSKPLKNSVRQTRTALAVLIVRNLQQHALSESPNQRQIVSLSLSQRKLPTPRREASTIGTGLPAHDRYRLVFDPPCACRQPGAGTDQN